jgi:hypothetical protein
MSKPKWIKYAPGREFEVASWLAGQLELNGTASRIKSLTAEIRPGAEFSNFESHIADLWSGLNLEALIVGGPPLVHSIVRARRLCDSFRDVASHVTFDGAPIGHLRILSELDGKFQKCTSVLDDQLATGKQTRLYLMQLRFLWIMEMSALPLEETLRNEFKRVKPTKDTEKSLEEFWDALQLLFTIHRRYKLKETSKDFSGWRADSVLLRNAIAHARTYGGDASAIRVDLYDRETESVVAQRSLSAKNLEMWANIVWMRVVLFYFLVCLNAALVIIFPNNSRVMINMFKDSESKGLLKKIWD